ncbi:hypothetical protein G7075_15575 [Phycicoccus sp. HDW14]|uniref:hypothetical protein n=1 Tax=Phycicoccus sp. HDW14 TaxID=2714941 RepID=UPI001407CA71|nr:hypothetical protein [Phycicoccus sp. HDW14]QIM22229.1 hypothetical protein G7075_15575 [Phycicoccus sp. HDW14]
MGRVSDTGSGRAVAVAAACAVLLLGACSGGSGDPAPRRSAPSTSSSASASPSASPSPTPKPGRVDTRAFFDDLEAAVAGQDTADVHLESPYEGIYAEIQTSTASMRVQYQDADRWLRVVVIGDRAWTLDENATDAPWKKVTHAPDDIRKAVPAHLVREWRAGARSVTRGSTETVEGHRITSYTVVLSAERAYGAIGLEAPRKGPSTVRLLVRLDERGLPTEASAALDKGKLEIEYRSWGAALEIVAPPVG